MQNKRVLLTIAAIFVAGILIVALLGRTPVTTTETTDVASAPVTAAEDNIPANTPAPAVVEEEPAAAATETAEAAEVAPAATTSETDLLAAPKSLTIDVAKAMEDRVLGKADAPVTIIEYASMTCPHCAHFANTTLSDVKKQLVETGKARLIYRDFPLDGVAAKAAAMARCADTDKYFDLVEVIFKDQERWIQAADPTAALTQLGTLAGMDEDYIKACMANTELQSALLKNMQDGQKKYEIKATPSFIFNEGAETFSGGKTVEEFVATVNKLSSGK